MTFVYAKSVKLALSLGFERIPDASSYNGECFIRDEKKWIHDINALKSKIADELSVDLISDSQLESLGYDVDCYHEFVASSDIAASRELAGIHHHLADGDSSPVYLSDGMWIFPDGRIGKL